MCPLILFKGHQVWTQEEWMLINFDTDKKTQPMMSVSGFQGLMAQLITLFHQPLSKKIPSQSKTMTFFNKSWEGFSQKNKCPAKLLKVMHSFSQANCVVYQRWHENMVVTQMDDCLYFVVILVVYFL
jgi:hypothetical protein